VALPQIGGFPGAPGPAQARPGAHPAPPDAHAKAILDALLARLDQAAPPATSGVEQVPSDEDSDEADAFSDSDDSDAGRRRRIDAVVKASAKKDYERKLKLAPEALRGTPVQDIVQCQDLWAKWVQASPDAAQQASRRVALVTALAEAMGINPPSGVPGETPTGLKPFLLELVGLILDGDGLQDRLTRILGLRVRFLMMEKRTDAATAKAWWASVGPSRHLAPPEDTSFIASYLKKAKKADARHKPAAPAARPSGGASGASGARRARPHGPSNGKARSGGGGRGNRNGGRPGGRSGGAGGGAAGGGRDMAAIKKALQSLTTALA
jgi:hypothetical protein